VVIHVEDGLVGENVQLLLAFTMDVDRLGVAQDVHQPGTCRLAGDDFGSQGDVVEQAGEYACRFGMLALLIQNMPFNRHEGAIVHLHCFQRGRTSGGNIYCWNNLTKDYHKLW
jgi:hypothetical protein